MRQYLDLLKDILENGKQREDRTGVGTIGVFGRQMRFSLRENNFPMITTKKLFFKTIVEELLWFLSGSTNVYDLRARGVSIWDAWAESHKNPVTHGDLGPIYGHQWRNFGASLRESVSGSRKGYRSDGVDQIKDVLSQIRTDPNSRRLVVTAWNPRDVPKASLPPCHVLFQFYVCDGELSCHMYQRSADMFIGVPYNIASYSLLTIMMAKVTGLLPGEFIHSIGDAHIYKNHIDLVQEQLSRELRNTPQIYVGDEVGDDLFSFRPHHFSLVDYNPHPWIKADVAV